MIKGLEENSQVCGVPADAIKQVKAQHVGVSKMAKQVCDAAAQGPRPTGPSFSEVLGSTSGGPGQQHQARLRDLRHAVG